VEARKRLRSLPKSRRRSLTPLLLALLSLVVSCRAAGEKPNVVLFLVDDMGWMDSSPYGSRYYETPNMERLARQGMRFTRAYSTPLCSPTRASILTGQSSARHGVTDASERQGQRRSPRTVLPGSPEPDRGWSEPESRSHLAPSQYTLAEALRDAGYRTGHFGKWHLGEDRAHGPDQEGFAVAFHAAPDASPPRYFSPYGFRFQSFADGPAGEYLTDRLTDEALRFMAENRDRPFFLNLWHYGVHSPWGHKKAYTRAFAGKVDPRGEQGNPIMASMLKSIDESLGRVLDQLEKLGIAERTIVIFHSDNGGNTRRNVELGRGRAGIQDWSDWPPGLPPTSNAPLRGGKGRLYEGGIRVPLMLAWPGVVPSGSTRDVVVGSIDLYPTILELVGVAIPARQPMDGLSFASVARGTGTLQREAFFTWFPHIYPGVAVHHGDWKLIRRLEPRPEHPGGFELYNLREDLGETRNLAAAMPEKVKQLDRLIDAFLRDTGALAPKPQVARP
jgi:arylsulfatase A-like enzyme